jgi:hypothetical protein
MRHQLARVSPGAAGILEQIDEVEADPQHLAAA